MSVCSDYKQETLDSQDDFIHKLFHVSVLLPLCPIILVTCVIIVRNEHKTVALNNHCRYSLKFGIVP